VESANFTRFMLCSFHSQPHTMSQPAAGSSTRRNITSSSRVMEEELNLFDDDRNETNRTQQNEEEKVGTINPSHDRSVG